MTDPKPKRAAKRSTEVTPIPKARTTKQRGTNAAAKAELARLAAEADCAEAGLNAEATAEVVELAAAAAPKRTRTRTRAAATPPEQPEPPAAKPKRVRPSRAKRQDAAAAVTAHTAPEQPPADDHTTPAPEPVTPPVAPPAAAPAVTASTASDPAPGMNMPAPTPDASTPAASAVTDQEFTFRADNGGIRTVLASAVRAIGEGRTMPDPRKPGQKVRGSVVYVERSGGAVVSVESADPATELRARLAAMTGEEAPTRHRRKITAPQPRAIRRDSSTRAVTADNPRTGRVALDDLANFVKEQLTANAQLTQTSLMHAALNAGIRFTRAEMIAAIARSGMTPRRVGRKGAYQHDAVIEAVERRTKPKTD